MIEKRKIGVVVLAAGASRRLGSPKQLISFNGKPLLQNVLNCAERIDFQTRVLVLGAYEAEIFNKIDPGSFEIALNDQWQEGMGGSLRVGLQKSLEIDAALDGLMILVSDQPFVNEQLLSKMIQMYEAVEDILACKYDDIIGVPVLFGAAYFDELKKVKGDKGAKQLLKKHTDHVKTIGFDHGIFDIDTPEDLIRLKEG